MTEKRKPDQEIIYQLEQVLRVIEWSQDVGYVAPGDIDAIKQWLSDYIENLRDNSANAPATQMQICPCIYKENGYNCCPYAPTGFCINTKLPAPSFSMTGVKP